MSGGCACGACGTGTLRSAVWQRHRQSQLGLGAPPAVMVTWPSLRPAEMPALPYQCSEAPGICTWGSESEFSTAVLRLTTAWGWGRCSWPSLLNTPRSVCVAI